MAKYKVIHGDMLEVLKNYEGCFDLAFSDPPYNLGQPYIGYDDNVDAKQFEAMVTHWMIRVWWSLKPTGVMIWHGNDYMAELYLRCAYEQQFPRIAWCFLHQRFGQHQDANWINSHCHCLIFAKDRNAYTWNPDDILVESDRKSTYGDGRIKLSKRGGSRVPLTVFGIPSDGPHWGRVQGNSQERRDGHPNQLPERYLERLIRAYSVAGDYICDGFGGSGTTAVVALALKRNVLTCDISEENCKSIKERIKKGAVRL